VSAILQPKRCSLCDNTVTTTVLGILQLANFSSTPQVRLGPIVLYIETSGNCWNVIPTGCVYFTSPGHQTTVE